MLRFAAPALAAFLALPAYAEPPRVVIDIAPIHALAAQVMAGVGTPALLLAQDANPHSVQLKPSQARLLTDADLVIWVGPALSPWLEKTIAGLGATESLALMEHPASTLRDFTPSVGMVADEHDHDAERDGHTHSGKDPHLWLSVDNARAWLGLFADTFAAHDPANAATYRANAARARADIDALTARIEATLAPVAGAEIITFHDSFGYFADRFPIAIAASVRPGDATSPSASALVALEELIANHDIACAFAEPAFDPGLLEAITAETGLRIGTLDPTGALLPPGPDHYATTLEALAEGIAACIQAK
ncbi:MAG: hypothetical protein AUK37_06710 [Rhodobacterales bacterium CG2_30_65_12]|nr:MAG: hypothetical protein AUK37_06710 [Rhodobacterales bacterium CG2_30_65_12]